MSSNIRRFFTYYGVPLLIWGGIFFSLFAIGNAIYPLFGGFGLAYIMSPLLRILMKRSIPRWIAVWIVYIGSMGILASLAIYVAPPALIEVFHLLQHAPDHLIKIYYQSTTILTQYEASLGWKYDVVPIIHQSGSHYVSSIMNTLTGSVETIISKITSTALSLANLALFPVFFYYGLARIHTIPNTLHRIIPSIHHGTLRYFLLVSDTVMGSYIRGQLIVSSTLGLLYATGLWGIGLPYGLLIGFLSGFLNIIPYFGFIAGISMGIITVIATGGSMILLGSVILVFIIAQAVESFILTPKIVGHTTGLDPLITLLVIMMGGNVMGLTGMLFSVPIAGILNRILTDYYAGNLTLNPTEYTG